MSGKGERAVLSDLGWSRAQITRYSSEGRLSWCARWESACTSNDWGHCVLAFWDQCPETWVFFPFSVLNSGNCATWGSYSCRMTCFPFSVVEGTVTSGTQWKINCEIQEGGGWVETFTSSLRRVLQKAFLSLPSFTSLIPCFSVVLLHACLDVSHTQPCN